MILNLRAKILIAAAVAVLGYVLLMPDDAPVEAARPERHAGDAAQAAARHQHSPQNKTGSVKVGFNAADRLVRATTAGALFAAHSWYVAPPPPPPAPVVVQAPPPPTAPPLPFAYMGTYKSQDGSPTYFLTAGDRVYDVKIGDVLDNKYSVDGVKSGQMLLTYMPLKTQQTLPVSDE